MRRQKRPQILRIDTDFEVIIIQNRTDKTPTKALQSAGFALFCFVVAFLLSF